jgi:hypothetical protein
MYYLGELRLLIRLVSSFVARIAHELQSAVQTLERVSITNCICQKKPQFFFLPTANEKHLVPVLQHTFKRRAKRDTEAENFHSRRKDKEFTVSQFHVPFPETAFAD